MDPKVSYPELSEKKLLLPKRILGIRWDKQAWIRGFFTGSAAAAILVLVLIMYSLLEQGSGFISSYRWELETYRKSGLEWVDIGKKPIAEHQQLYSLINRAYQAEINTQSGEAKARRDEALLAKRHLEDGTRKLLRLLALAKESNHTERITKFEAELKAVATKIAEAEVYSAKFTKAESEQLRQALLHQTLAQTEENPPALQAIIDAATQAEAQARSAHTAFADALASFDEAIYPLQDWEDPAKKLATDTKKLASARRMAEAEKAQLLIASEESKEEEDRARFLAEAKAVVLDEINYEEAIQPLMAMRGTYESLVPTYLKEVQSAFVSLPSSFKSSQASALYEEAKQLFELHQEHVQTSVSQLKTWSLNEPISGTRALVLFLTGGDWVTNSSWQDFYGVLPLLSGSVVISAIALSIALPFSIGAAIYTNQFASPREQNLIKPIIEFIQAIPSVVIGFIGISLVGDLIKDVSQVSWLQWIPGFPIQERLNMFTAGVLLALMAIPTIFSLAEDAIQNVPRAFSEASEALGATKLQGVFRVIVPSATSGILAAVLLGLGRIIGETMVVLLVAGNRIEIPNFSDGFGTVFQPAHTLTGIIAQELGEVSKGSVHWEALFMVGILLFIISLSINWASRFIARKFQLPKI